jgi:hypothetical protein
MTLIIHIDSVEKRRNSKEQRNVPRASCEGFEEAGDHRVIVSLCKRLLEAGYPPEKMVEVRRGDMVVFHAGPLGRWAELKGWGNPQPASLQKHD